MAEPMPEEYFDDDEYDEGDWEEEWDFDCGADQTGACSMAGSEDCDFECPYREEMNRRLARHQRKEREAAGQKKLPMAEPGKAGE